MHRQVNEEPDPQLLEAVGDALRAPQWLPPIPGSLTNRYEAQLLAERRRFNRPVSLLLIALFCGFWFSELPAPPVDFELSGFFRFAIIAPITLAVVFCDMRGWLGRFYDLACFLVAMLPQFLSTMLFFASFTQPDLAGIRAVPIILLASSMLARLTLTYQFWNIGLSVALYIIPLLISRSIPLSDITTQCMMELAIATTGLFFVLETESRERRVFLLHVTDEINRAMLAQENQGLARATRTDTLTNVGNRRFFDESLERAWSASRLRGTPVGLMMIDPDHFKKYNSHYGHRAGDACLQTLAQAIDSQMRAQDMVARYDGELFAVILPATSLARTRQMAEAIQAAVADLAVPHAGAGPGGVLTLSIGFTCIVPAPGEGPKRIIAAAGRYLYEAKQSGRNRICGG